MISISNCKSIREVRLSLDKTQNEIAQAISISESYYNLIENGKRRASVDLAAKISKELGLSLDKFFVLYNFIKCKAQ